MTERIYHKGKFNIFINSQKITAVDNRITDAGLTADAAALAGRSNEIKYIAFGDSDSPVTGTEVQLGNETFRQGVTEFIVDNGSVTSIFVILSGEAIGIINEVGIFCGSEATEETGSGILLSRILWPHQKTADEEIRVERIDTFLRGE